MITTFSHFSQTWFAVFLVTVTSGFRHFLCGSFIVYCCWTQSSPDNQLGSCFQRLAGSEWLSGPQQTLTFQSDADTWNMNSVKLAGNRNSAQLSEPAHHLD